MTAQGSFRYNILTNSSTIVCPVSLLRIKQSWWEILMSKIIFGITVTTIQMVIHSNNFQITLTIVYCIQQKTQCYPPNNSSQSWVDLMINKNVANMTESDSIPEISSDYNPVDFNIEGWITENIGKHLWLRTNKLEKISRNFKW